MATGLPGQCGAPALKLATRVTKLEPEDVKNKRMVGIKFAQQVLQRKKRKNVRMEIAHQVSKISSMNIPK